MNQTTNYNFNVPVGSDIVNSLVQDFPNWESLDTILRNIANTGVVTATHTKTGTIHTLSFTDTTVPMIRFQATADFATNDTFTVNGLSVSALTVSGEALPDGAFVIGSMVLCELRDNLLTVYTSGSDASTLEGHPASYFATASNLQTVDNKADANKLLIDQINIDLINKEDKHGSVSVTADGVKSYRTLFNELNALIDRTKLTDIAVLKTGQYVLQLVRIQSNDLWFSFCQCGSDNITVRSAVVGTTSHLYNWNGSTYTTIDSTVPTNGDVIKLTY